MTTPEYFRKIGAQEFVVVMLHSPREKYWGRLDELNPAGVFLRGLDLNSFEDWLRSLSAEDASHGPSTIFFPMWRVERLSLDEAGYGIPAMWEQAERRAGRPADQLLYN